MFGRCMHGVAVFGQCMHGVAVHRLSMAICFADITVVSCVNYVCIECGCLFYG